MRNNVEVLAEDAKRYAELHLAMQRGWMEQIQVL